MTRYLSFALLVLVLSLGPLLAGQNYPANGQSSATQDNSNQNNSNDSSPTLGARSTESTGTSHMTLPQGTQLAIRTNETIDSKTAEANQTFAGEVAEDVLDANGHVVIPKHSPAMLVLRSANKGGTTGTPELVLDLKSITVNGHTYHVSSSDVAQSAKNQGIGKNKRTGEYVGGGAVLGTVIGAVAGGGKGAAIGALAGAAAGGGAQVLTKGKEVKIPAETVLKFQLQQPLHLRG